MAIKHSGKTLTRREQAQYVRELAGWTREEYNKEYDKLRNRVRTYEKATGLEKGSINVADLLAREVRSDIFDQRFEKKHKPTLLWNAIQSTPARSSGAPLSKTLEMRLRRVEFSRIREQFGGVIYRSKYSDEIAAWRKSHSRATPAQFLAFVEGKARALDQERAEVAAYNAQQRAVGSLRRRFFHST